MGKETAQNILANPNAPKSMKDKAQKYLNMLEMSRQSDSKQTIKL